MKYDDLPEDIKKKMALSKAIKTTIGEEFSQFSDKMSICGMLVNGILAEELKVSNVEGVRRMMNMWLKHVEGGFDLVELTKIESVN